MAPTCLLPASHVSTTITIDPTRESRRYPAPLQPRHLTATAPPLTRVPTACAELHESEAEARANMHAMRRQIEVLRGERLAGAEEANLARADAASAVSAARAELREEFDRGARQATSGRAEEVATARAEAAAASEARAEERWAVREAALRAEEAAARACLETALAAARAEAAGVRASRQELEGAQFAACAAAAMATERAREVRAALSMAREQHEARIVGCRSWWPRYGRNSRLRRPRRRRTFGTRAPSGGSLRRAARSGARYGTSSRRRAVPRASRTPDCSKRITRCVRYGRW